MRSLLAGLVVAAAAAGLCAQAAPPPGGHPPPAAASPHPFPRAQPSPTPGDESSPGGGSAEAAPGAAPAGAAAKPGADLSLVDAPERTKVEAFADLPVSRPDAAFAPRGGRLFLYESNALGQPGRRLASLPPGDPRGGGPALCDPGPIGDRAAWDAADDLAGPAGGRWLLVEVQGFGASGPLRWRRLLDRQEPGGSAWFRAAELFPGAGPRAEQEYRDGRLWRSTAYDAAGDQLREFGYGPDGRWNECAEWLRRDGRLVQSTLRGPDGRLVQASGYDYTLDGRIRETERRYADGRVERFAFRYGAAGLEDCWLDGTADGIHWLYDAQGRLVRQEEWAGGAEVRRVANSWVAGQSDRLASRETSDFADKRVLLELFDDGGRLVQADETIAGELASRTSLVWNADGSLAERHRAGTGPSEDWLWDYDSGKLAAERYSKDGVPVRVTKYRGNDRSDELYMGGEPVLRVYYRDNRRVKEEELRNGNIVRTRTFK